jgi:hypothetical protein
MNAVRENLARVRENILKAQSSAGASPSVRIVAVTKGHGPEAVEAAIAARVPDIGENRVQEAMAKQDALPAGTGTWHLIGHLQTNKAKFVPGRFVMVQSVDSRKVADALSAAAHKAGATLAVLVQVNVALEAQKTGCTPDEAADIAGYVSELPGLTLEGLMTMAPFTDDVAVQRKVFADLRTLRDRIATPNLRLPQLSMGMSGDYESAVAEGATIVRLGTVLFGERVV